MVSGSESMTKMKATCKNMEKLTEKKLFLRDMNLASLHAVYSLVSLSNTWFGLRFIEKNRCEGKKNFSNLFSVSLQDLLPTAPIMLDRSRKHSKLS